MKVNNNCLEQIPNFNHSGYHMIINNKKITRSTSSNKKLFLIFNCDMFYWGEKVLIRKPTITWKINYYSTILKYTILWFYLFFYMTMRFGRLEERTTGMKLFWRTTGYTLWDLLRNGDILGVEWVEDNFQN